MGFRGVTLRGFRYSGGIIRGIILRGLSGFNWVYLGSPDLSDLNLRVRALRFRCFEVNPAKP